MDIHILTLFPNMFTGPFQDSIVARAKDKNIVEISIHNIRDYSSDRHKSVDDLPFGGGGGMVLKPEPLFTAIETIKNTIKAKHEQKKINMEVLLLSPQGQVLNQELVINLSKADAFIIICGHYEGVDQRVIDELVDREVSIGDYVLTGGEIPAMVLIDSLVRLLPGSVGDRMSIEDDTHHNGLLQFPQYTRPSLYRGLEVPPILLSGSHKNIYEWRRRQSLRRTLSRRPDLLSKLDLNDHDKSLLNDSGEGE